MELNVIIEKISRHVPDANTGRGDHDLNPDMGVAAELTPAAVLVPLVLRDDGITVLFTQRTTHLEHHPGQVSFPGGHVDPGDRTPDDTALRETEEEVGLDRRHIEIIGHLDVYRTRTGFSVTPVVGLVTPPFEIDPDTHEVEEVFEAPLPFLLNTRNHERHTREIRGVEREFYAMPYNGHYIWGATAGMLVNLCDILTGN